MNWLNLPVSLSRSPEYIGADKDQRSTWFSLINYCAEQENGGTITNCRRWKSRQWEQSCAVTSDEVARECDLFWWDGDDLNVAFYPIGREKQVKDGRAGGLKGGRPRKPKNPSENPPPDEGKAPPKPEDKIREGNIREEKRSSSGDDTNPSEQAITLCETHPSRDKSQPALRAALGAITRHGFAIVLEGVRGYAAQVESWTPAERAQFVKNAPEFFGEDLWNKPAENFRGRINGHNGHTKRRSIDIGGRGPSFALMDQIYGNTEPAEP